MTNKDCWNILERMHEAQINDLTFDVVKDIRRGLKHAKKIGHNQLHYQFASALHHYYYVVAQDEKKAIAAGKEVDSAQELWVFEEFARKRHDRIIYLNNRSRKGSAELSQLCEEMDYYFNGAPCLANPTIALYVYPVLIASAYHKQDYKTALLLCENAVHLFEKHKLNKAYFFAKMMLPGLIVSGRFKKVLSLSKESKKRIVGGRLNWSIFVYYSVIASLHLKDYKGAYDRLLEADSKRQINPALKEQWNITKGFVQILSNAGLVKSKRFRISKILNELPIFSKDKEGNYINILILRIIIGIQENRSKLIQDKETLRQLHWTHCPKQSRSHLFIKMLLRIPNLDFDSELIRKETESDLEKLKSMEQTPENIDIIPWPELWEIVLKGL